MKLKWKILASVVAAGSATFGLTGCDQQYANDVCAYQDAAHPEIPGELYYRQWDPGNSSTGEDPHVNCGWNDLGYIRWGCYYPTPNSWVYPCLYP